MSGEPVLVIDDNPLNLKLVRFLLEKNGLDVRTAVDAEDALRVLEGFSPRLILTDIQMPGMDGLALTRLLRADPRFRETFILAITASAMKGDEEKAAEAGCDGYVTKPIDTRALPAVVASFLSRRR